MLFFLKKTDAIPLYFGQDGLSIAQKDKFFCVPVINRALNDTQDNNLFVEWTPFIQWVTETDRKSEYEYKLWNVNKKDMFMGFSLNVLRIREQDSVVTSLDCELLFGKFSKKAFLEASTEKHRCQPIVIKIMNKDRWHVSFYGLDDFYWLKDFGAMLFVLDNITRRLSYLVSNEYTLINTNISIIPAFVSRPSYHTFYIENKTPSQYILEKMSEE